MRIVVSEFESSNADVDQYDFLGSILTIIKAEPFFLRHEYYDHEKHLKQSLYLFGRRTNEQGAQVFIHSYFGYLNNLMYNEDLAFYKNQKKEFRFKGAKGQDTLNLLPEIKGGVSCDLLTTKDGKYRRRVLYDIKGKHNSILIVFSINSDRFIENLLFNFVKDNFKVEIE